MYSSQEKLKSTTSAKVYHSKSLLKMFEFLRDSLMEKRMGACQYHPSDCKQTSSAHSR